MSTEVLSKRIQALEKVVLGPEGSSERSHSRTEAVVPFLNNFAIDLGNAVEKRERIRSLLRDVPSLNTFLDPNFGEEKGLPLSMKGDLLLAQAEDIAKTNALLERVEKSRGVLDQSQELEKAVHNFEPAFDKLAKIQVEQERKAQSLSVETLELMQKYNELIEVVSKSFIEYDNLLSRAEGSK